MTKKKIRPWKTEKPPANSDLSPYQEVWYPVNDYDLVQLAIIVRKAYTYPKGSTMVAGNGESLKVSTVRTNLPAKIGRKWERPEDPPHIKRQRVLVVRRGLILLTLFYPKDRPYRSVWLQEGDTAIILNGESDLSLEGQCDLLDIKN